MIGYLLIILFTVLNLGESIAVKAYAKRHQSGGMIMNAIIALFAALFFLITDKNGLYFPKEMIPLAVINAFLFAFGFYFTFLAFKVGPYGLTRLISNLSLMFGIFYGIFFLHEETTALTYIGIALIVVAVFLLNCGGKKKDGEEGGISLKWFIFVMISVFSNGFIAILTKMQQIKFDNACSNEFQMISIGGSFLLLGILGLIIDRKNLGYILKHGTLYGAVSGLFNGAKNLTLIAVYLFLPLSTVAPMKTGLSIVAAFLLSVLFYKEKYTLLQKIGVITCAAAVIILAL